MAAARCHRTGDGPPDRCDDDGMTAGARYLGAMRVVERAGEIAQGGTWILEATHGWANVHSLVPDVFERYARIFHPAMREADERDLPLLGPHEAKTGAPVRTRGDGLVWCEVTWAEVAQANGRAAHAAMEWTAITGSYEFDWHGMQPGIWDRVPQRGSLPLRLARRLCDHLAHFTDTPELCWCASWEGDGNLIGLRSDLMLPRLAMRQRPMLVARGPLRTVTEKSFTDGFEPWDQPEHPQFAEHYRSPSLWWPDDRAWCVATDVDLQSTYVGASAECVDRLLQDERLEVMQTSAEQSVTIDADTINPTPLGQRDNR